MSGAHRLRKHLTRRLGWTQHMIVAATLPEIESQYVMHTGLLLNLQEHLPHLR
jgi:hypothetical protein